MASARRDGGAQRRGLAFGGLQEGVELGTIVMLVLGGGVEAK